MITQSGLHNMQVSFDVNFCKKDQLNKLNIEGIATSGFSTVRFLKSSISTACSSVSACSSASFLAVVPNSDY